MVGRAEPRARAAILAGGRATRLGGKKPTAELAGRPLITYPLAAAGAAGLNPFVVAKGDTVLPELECEVTLEPDLPVHPLRGILTAIELCEGPVLALGCDMPFVTAPLLSWLAQSEPPAVAEVDGRLEPLLAVYGPAAAPTLAAALEREDPLREALERLAPQRLGEAQLGRFGDPSMLVRSVNTHADLQEAGLLVSR